MEESASAPVQPKERNSSFEILRIIAILIVILHHFAAHGEFIFAAVETTPTVLFNNYYFGLLLQIGKVGVNLFILISSYFLINTKFRTKKFLTLFLEMLSVSIIAGLTFMLIKQEEITWVAIKTMLFPFVGGEWWFMTAYLILYLLSPVLNLAIKAMGKKTHLVFTIIFFLMWSVIMTILDHGYSFNYAFNNVVWFITLYFIGSYLRLHGVNFDIKPAVGIILSVMLFLTIYTARWLLLTYVESEEYFFIRLTEILNLSAVSNVFQFLCTFLIFISFSKIHIKPNKTINFIASNVLMVYILHEQAHISTWLWLELFKVNTFIESEFLALYSLGVALAIFAIGVAVGIIYKFTLGKLYNLGLDALDKKCLYKLDNLLNNIGEQPTETTN